MNLTETIDKYEKAIKILLLIGECERLILLHTQYIRSKKCRCVGYAHNTERKEANEAIKTKLERYYNSTFKIN